MRKLILLAAVAIVMVFSGQAMASGGDVYAKNGCGGCHGKEAAGGIGPKLAGSDFIKGDADEIKTVIRDGRKGTMMSAFDVKRISDGDLDTLIEFLKGL